MRADCSLISASARRNQGLKLIQALPEGAAFGHIGQCAIPGPFAHHQGRGGDVQAPAIQPGHGIGKTFANLSQQVVCWRQAIIHLHGAGGLRTPTHLMLQPAEGQAGCAGFNHNGRNALGATAPRSAP